MLELAQFVDVGTASRAGDQTLGCCGIKRGTRAGRFLTLGSPLVRVGLAALEGGPITSSRGRPTLIPRRRVGWTFQASGTLTSQHRGARPQTPKVGYVRNPSGYSEKVRTAMGRQICAGGSASGASKPASTTTAFRSRQGQKRNPPLQPGGLETFIGGLNAELKPDSFLSRGVFPAFAVPSCRPGGG
jgi:hypothetical protein